VGAPTRWVRLRRGCAGGVRHRSIDAVVAGARQVWRLAGPLFDRGPSVRVKAAVRLSPRCTGVAVLPRGFGKPNWWWWAGRLVVCPGEWGIDWLAGVLPMASSKASALATNTWWFASDVIRTHGAQRVVPWPPTWRCRSMRCRARHLCWLCLSPSQPAPPCRYCRLNLSGCSIGLFQTLVGCVTGPVAGPTGEAPGGPASQAWHHLWLPAGGRHESVLCDWPARSAAPLPRFRPGSPDCRADPGGLGGVSGRW